VQVFVRLQETGAAQKCSTGDPVGMKYHAPMCTNFTPVRHERWVTDQFGVTLPPQAYSAEAFPGYMAPIVMRGPDTREGANRIELARFGLIPHWAKDDKAGRNTYNARSETISEKPSFRTAWRQRQFAITLMEDFFEPCYESGHNVRWRIRRADGQPMGVASLWDTWLEQATGEVVNSFTMITVNADVHPVMGRFHPPQDEKRSLVVLEPVQFSGWLEASVADAPGFLNPPAPEVLVSEAAPTEAQLRRTQSLF